jgi:hypothetical protein
MKLGTILAFAVFVLGACSNSDGGGDGGPLYDGAACPTDLATVGQECPQTFDGAEANLPACTATGADVQQTVWSCQDLIILQLRRGVVASVCYYDSTSHALVGAAREGAGVGDCDPTSVGRTNSMCRENAPSASRTCN